ncbi:MAG: hypothetical protein D3909_00625 [Candidatus Electrothrix sp. ATG1]|nr:hypothetical protein [Candidatus Electrothrix sp. ATG1]MCI5208336.1 hypothetical protein [Candidatus Electrothrix sp. ATG2]
MERNIWLMLVNQSGKGLYKKGYLGREVYEFEIEAALEAQRVFAEMTSTEKLHITSMEFTTPPAGSTYRTITEPIHRKITAAPSIMESAWVNVWHSVAEASFLISAGTTKVMSFLDEYDITGLAAYLAYCRECRDWVPTPRMFSELSSEVQDAWHEVETVAGKMMAAGFTQLDFHLSQTEH